MPRYGHLPGLVDVDGWEAMAPGDAAQAVQRSAHPGAYAAHVDAAQRLMTALSGVEVNIDSTATMCSAAGDIGATGDAKAAIDRGRGLLGTPYEFGGGGAHGPDTGIDCSGFIQYMLAAVGVTDLPRTSQQQFLSLIHIYVRDALPAGLAAVVDLVAGVEEHPGRRLLQHQ